MHVERTREEREARLFATAEHVFALTATVHSLREEATYLEHGRGGLTLVKNDELRVVVEVLRRGAGLAEHRAPGPITVQVLEGELRFETEGDVLYLRRGELLALPAGRPHAVEAVQDSAFLLTIAPAAVPGALRS